MSNLCVLHDSEWKNFESSGFRVSKRQIYTFGTIRSMKTSKMLIWHDSEWENVECACLAQF